MTSLAKEFWQTMLAQGIGLGIGTGLIFLPALSVVSQFFLKRRSLALGIATTGSSIGGESTIELARTSLTKQASVYLSCSTTSSYHMVSEKQSNIADTSY